MIPDYLKNGHLPAVESEIFMEMRKKNGPQMGFAPLVP
jgi:hypothetical protein